MPKTRQILSNRGKQYGETWRLAGLVIQTLQEPFNHLVTVAPQYSHNWVLMLSKLIRILYSPYNVDHWEDLIGYATLCLKDIERNSNDNVQQLRTPAPTREQDGS